MKKITIIAVLLALTWQANAQQERSEVPLENRHEIKLDPAHLIAGTLRIDYEYLLNDWSSVGLGVFYNFSRTNDYGTYYRTKFLGFYRLYFGRRPSSGFFLEGNLGVVSGFYSDWWSSYPSNRGDFTAFGTGIALGWKWYIPRAGIVLDVFGGGGRLFGGDDRPNMYPRFGISVGKRF